MTPLVPPPPQQHGSDTGRRTVAFLVGFLAGLLVVCAAAVGYVSRASRATTEGWRLRPVLVCAVDVAAGAELKMDDLSQRSIPEQFLAGDEVAPDQAAAIIGKRPFLALQLGDALRHGYLGAVAVDGCLESVRGVADQLGTASQPGVAALLDALARSP